MPVAVLAPKAPAVRKAPPLPLFTTGRHGDDEPLVKLPAAPRPPLAVRRTPEAPRVRPAPKVQLPRVELEPVLQFTDEPQAEEPGTQSGQRLATSVRVRQPSGMVPRVTAALIDHLLLLAIDLVVLYFTFRMASLAMGDWRVLPPVPMLAFLVMLKLAYFSAFTIIGGQTIGKMAARIRVVGEEEDLVDPARAFGRALAGALSLLPFGLGFVLAFISPDGRAFHDRVARTRVVTVASA